MCSLQLRLVFLDAAGLHMARGVQHVAAGEKMGVVDISNMARHKNGGINQISVRIVGGALSVRFAVELSSCAPVPRKLHETSKEMASVPNGRTRVFYTSKRGPVGIPKYFRPQRGAEVCFAKLVPHSQLVWSAGGLC